MKDDVTVRPMTRGDIPAVYETAALAFANGSEEENRALDRSPTEVASYRARYHHIIEHDPDGCWVTESEGRVVGVGVSIRREGLWGLSLLAVDATFRGRGVGTRLLERALAYAEGCRARMTVSSTHPAAIRRYATAGLHLRPTLKASGVVRRGALPASLQGVRDGDEGDLDLAAEVDRRVRGAAHGPDLAFMLRTGRLLVCDNPSGRGYAVMQDGTLALLAATENGVAAKLLWACLAEGKGEGMEVRWIGTDQSWAVPVVLSAGLDLSPAGPVCVSGETGPLSPYIPSGAFL